MEFLKKCSNNPQECKKNKTEMKKTEQTENKKCHDVNRFKL